MCATFVTQVKCYTGSIFPCRGLSPPNAQAFWSVIAICTSLPRQLFSEAEKRLVFLHRQLSRFKWNTRISHCRLRSVFKKSCPWVKQSLQFVGNQNIVKPRLMFLTTNRNAEILSEGFNDRFSRYWMYWLFMNFNCRVSSFEEPCPWVEVFFSIVCRT